MKRLRVKDIANLPQHDLNAYLGISGHFGGLKSTQKLIELTKIANNKRILDVGCGIGNTSFYISKKFNCNIIGFDISKIGIEKACKKNMVSKNINFFVADLQNTPIKDERFDAIIVENVLTLCENKRKALEELARITKPGGFIGLNEIFWAKKPESIKYDKKTGEIKEETKIYKTKIFVFPTFNELMDLLKKSKFKCVKYYESPKLSFFEKILFSFKNVKKIIIFFKIMYLSALNKELRERFLISNKHQNSIKKGTEVGFGLFIIEK